MDLQQCYDMMVVPSINRTRRQLDAAKSVIENVKQLQADTLHLVRERKSTLNMTLTDTRNMNMNLSLDAIPQWLKAKSLENQEKFQSEIERKVRALDQEIEVIIARENALREAKLGEAKREYDINSKPIQDLVSLRQGLIDQGFENAWAAAGYAPSATEYFDVTSYSIDECYEKLANAPMPKVDENNRAVSPYEYCVENPAVSCSILAVFIVLALTPIFNIVSIIGVIALILLIGKQVLLQRKVSEVFSIISGFNFSDYTHEFIPPEGTSPISDEEINSLPIFEGFEERYIALEKEAEEYPLDEYELMLQEFEFKKSEFNVQLKQDLQAMLTLQSEIINEIIGLLKECDEMEQNILANFKRVGERRSNNFVFKHCLSLGFNEGEDEILDAESANILVPHTVDDEVKNNLARVFIANLFSNIKLGMFNVYVYDPHTYGAAIMPMYNEKLYSAITFEQEQFSNIMKKVQKNSKRMLEISGGENIDMYNKIAEEQDKVPSVYNFVMVLSDVEAFTKKESYVKFAEKAHLTGTYFWVFADKPVERGSLANFLWLQEPYRGIPHPMKLTTSECNEFARSYGDDLENNNKPKGLKWKDFMANVCPDDQLWTRTTDNEVKLFPGYVDGDPSKAQFFELGNTGNVHCLAAGATGSGKSVFLNHLIMTLCSMYSPAELQLWLCDFKGSEFGKYIMPEGTNYILPHIKTCLCTADGDFAASVFSGMEDEGKRRYAMMQKPTEYLDSIPYFPEGEEVPPATDGAKNWNRYWKKRASETGNDMYLNNCFARILCIVDEFQNIFQNAEQDAIDILIKACTWLAKVGRASNINVLFSSQTLTGTLSDDVLSQMTCRFALRCGKDISNILLGTDNAATIKYSYGFLYATATGIDEENQPFIKTPYLDDYKAGERLGDVAELIEKLHVKMEELTFFTPYDVVTYLEVTKHPIEEVKEVFETYKDKLPDQGVIFTGAPMVYTTNKVPNNFVLARKNNTHILSCFGDMNDFVLFFKQTVECLRNNKTKPTIMINSQVQDLAYVCEAEAYVEDVHKPLIDKSVTCIDMVNLLNDLYIKRKDREGSECSPVYVFLLGWDKGNGICIEPNVDVRSKFINILQVCGEKNIHVIMINQTMIGVSVGIINACKYRLAGFCSADDSMNLLGKRHASKNFEGMPRGWVYSMIDSVLTKSKLFISPINRVIEKDNIVI